MKVDIFYIFSILESTKSAYLILRDICHNQTNFAHAMTKLPYKRKGEKASKVLRDILYKPDIGEKIIQLGSIENIGNCEWHSFLKTTPIYRTNTVTPTMSH